MTVLQNDHIYRCEAGRAVRDIKAQETLLGNTLTDVVCYQGVTICSLPPFALPCLYGLCQAITALLNCFHNFSTSETHRQLFHLIYLA